MQIELVCERIAMKTGEHCPRKPMHILYEGNEVFCLCNRCYITYQKRERDKDIKKYKVRHPNASLRQMSREFNVSYGVIEKALR